MRAIKNIIQLLGLVLLIACQENDNLFYGSGSIQGYAYKQDTNENVLPKKLPDKEIFLTDKNNDPNYFLYRTRTDSAGFYNIGYLETGTYYIYTKYSQPDSLAYYGESGAIIVSKNQITNADLYVYPDLYNGLVIKLVDDFGTNVNNFILRVYINKTAALQDDTNFAFRKSRTNANGFYKLYNIPPTMYYIVAKDSLANKLMTGNDTITVSNKGVKSRSILVK
jgi:hypothetical protein